MALLNTHAHFDHSGHIPTVREHWGVEWWLHPDDTFLQSLAQQSAARWGLPPLQNLPWPIMTLLMERRSTLEA